MHQQPKADPTSDRMFFSRFDNEGSAQAWIENEKAIAVGRGFWDGRPKFITTSEPLPVTTIVEEPVKAEPQPIEEQPKRQQVQLKRKVRI